ncbi:SEC-C metal-binding domain-containing protein [Bacteroides sp.]
MEALDDFFSHLIPKELDYQLNGVQQPYVNPFKAVGRSDPCPCGSSKNFKKRCGR